MNKEKFWHSVYWVMLVIISALLGAILTLLVISFNKNREIVIKSSQIDSGGVLIQDLFDSSYAGWVYFGNGNDSIYIYKKKSYDLVIKDTIYLHDTVFVKKQNKNFLKKPNRKRAAKTNTNLNDGFSFKCDSATKAFNVMYWKTQCERIRHHNEVLPEEAEFLPRLSADSCLVEFLY